MLTNFSSKVGAKIRTYRKARNMSLDELSAKINKSKATISKYESGAIAIDIMTLYEISIILQIDITKLVENVASPTPSIVKLFETHLPSTLYMYHAHHHKHYLSILNLGATQDNSNIPATLYYKTVDHAASHIKCAGIYHGNLLYSNTHLNLSLTNFQNEFDAIYLLFFIPMEIAEAYSGILLGLQSANMRPAATRVLLSAHALSKNYLEENLKFTHKDWRRLKNGSYYSMSDL